MITLETARDAVGLTINEAAKHCKEPVREMERLEADPGTMPASMVIKLRRIYGVPIDYISI